MKKFKTFSDLERTYPRHSYLILEEGEADKEAFNKILSMAWALKPRLLAKVTGVPREVFDALNYTREYEKNNNIVLRLIPNKKEFVEEIIQEVGRAHFLSSYDEEIKCLIEDSRKTYYIYAK